MRSQLGQEMLRGDLSGSVVDHITVDHVSEFRFPVFSDEMEEVAELVRRATALRDNARFELRDAVRTLERKMEALGALPLDGASPRIWTQPASAFQLRLDAAYHDDLVREMREVLRTSGGLRLGDIATVVKPAGRYKTYYVEYPNGRPLLSGRQLLQYDVVGAKRISERSISDPTLYELKESTVCFQADGRAEEALGVPVLITDDRAGWLASGHVGRVIPHDLRDSGWVWASIATSQVQSQIASLACGSVVDALYPEDLVRVLLPPRDLIDSDAVTSAWKGLENAARLESAAIERLERRFPIAVN